MDKKERIKKEKQLKRDMIMEAAMKIFSRLGYDRATVNDIAGEAGYSKSNIYFYFKDKDEIFNEIMKNRNQEKERAMDDILAVKGPAEKKLKLFIDLTFDYVKNHKDIIRLVHSEQHKLHSVPEKENKFRAIVQGDMHKAAAVLVSIFEEGIKSGSFKNIDPQKTALVVMGMFGVPIVHWFQGGFKIDLESYKEQIYDIIMTGITK